VRVDFGGTRPSDAYTFSMVRDSRIYVKATPEEREVFEAVAAALGQSDNVSAAIRGVMFEKARQLGLMKPPRKGQPKRAEASR
jgi:hypothetical protein